MGVARLAIYLIGLALVVTATWIFLTQTPLGAAIPSGVAVALILLLVGIGVMAAARNVNETSFRRRVVHDGYAGPGYGGPAYGPGAPPPATYDRTTRVYETGDVPPGETVVEERRFE